MLLNDKREVISSIMEPLVLIFLFIFAAFCSWVIFSLVALNRNYSQALNTASAQYVIEEMFIDNPFSHAQRMADEAEMIWSSDASGWKEEVGLNPAWKAQYALKVESKSVAGPQSVFHMPLQRASSLYMFSLNISASTVFKYLTSAKG
jgi:hypothetical protein